jgi:hypothetical protein
VRCDVSPSSPNLDLTAGGRRKPIFDDAADRMGKALWD